VQAKRHGSAVRSGGSLAAELALAGSARAFTSGVELREQLFDVDCRRPEL